MILDIGRILCYNVIKETERVEDMKKLLVACVIALIGAVTMVGCSPTGAKNDCCSSESKSDCCKAESEKDCCEGKDDSEDTSKKDCCKDKENSEESDCCKDKENSDNNSSEDISDVPDCCAGD